MIFNIRHTMKHLLKAIATLSMMVTFWSCEEVAPRLESIRLSQPSLSMIVGEEQTLVVSPVPESISLGAVLWSTTDPAVATVNEGTVKAVKEGSATIVASVDGKTASCIVTIDYHHVSQIVLSPEVTALYPGERTTINATVLPSNATYPDLSWYSSDTSVATISSGLLSAINSGTATITAKCRDMEETVSITVLVPVVSVSIDKTSFTLSVGECVKLNASISPADAVLREALRWTSSAEDVAMVSNDGQVTALKLGTSIITVNADGKESTCNIYVTTTGGGNEGTGEEIWK